MQNQYPLHLQTCTTSPRKPLLCTTIGVYHCDKHKHKVYVPAHAKTLSNYSGFHIHEVTPSVSRSGELGVHTDFLPSPFFFKYLHSACTHLVILLIHVTMAPDHTDWGMSEIICGSVFFDQTLHIAPILSGCNCHRTARMVTVFKHHSVELEFFVPIVNCRSWWRLVPTAFWQFLEA